MNKPAKLVTVAALLAFTLPLATAAYAETDAAKLWSKNCAACHGKEGKGDTKAGEKMGVKDLTNAEVKGGLTHDGIVKLIAEGVMNEETGKPKMKPYKEKLSAEEIAALADYVLALK